MPPERRASYDSLAMVFISGVSGFILVLVYLRLASLAFGQVATAQTTTRLVFMIGVVMGVFVGGHVTDRLQRPLFVYGICQSLTGLFCSGMLILFRIITPGYIQAVAPYPDSNFWSIFSQVLRAGMVMALPAFLMGASLPLISRHLILKPSHAVKRFCRIVGIQILGAGFGSFLAMYWLMPKLGMASTLYLAAATHFLVGLWVIIFQIRSIRTNVSTLSPSIIRYKVSELDKGPLTLPYHWILIIIWLSGFYLFSLCALWSHAMPMTLGGYDWGTIFTPGLLGLALGALLVPTILQEVSDTRRLLIWLSSFTAIVLAIHLIVWSRLPYFLRILTNVGPGFWAQEAGRLASVGLILLIPTICLGMLLPALIGPYLCQNASLGRTIGTMVAVNAWGGIAGWLWAAFFLIPRIGSEWSFNIYVMISALVPIPFWCSLKTRLSARRLAIRTIFLPVVVAILILFSNWSPKSFASVASFLDVSSTGHSQRWLYNGESFSAGATMVLETEEGRYLLKHGQVVGASHAKSAVIRQMALVPVMLLSQPESAFVMGLGTGQVLESMVMGNFQRIDVVEMNPDIMTIAERFFLSAKPQVLSDPRVKITNADGRNFLLLHPETRYDLIAIHEMSPFKTGWSTWYSREFFELCRNRLRRGGVLQQRLELERLRWEDQLIAINTIAEVFPYLALWRFADKISVLASEVPLLWDYEVVTRRISVFQNTDALSDFALPNLFSIFAHYYLDNTAVRAILRDTMVAKSQKRFITTDFHPLLEYGAARKTNHLDTAWHFFQKTAPYSYLPLESILVNIPQGKAHDLIRLIENERMDLTAFSRSIQ